MELVNLETGDVLADRVLKAHTFARRLKGLMFTKTLDSGTCLHIKPCRSIHTFFMNYPIDVLHLDSNEKIVGMEICLKPGKLGTVFPRTASVIELPAGSIEQEKTKIGQAVQFKSKGEIINDEQN